MPNMFSDTMPEVKKEVDPFTDMIDRLSFVPGFKYLDILVIGDTRGLIRLHLSGARVYTFSKIERETHLYRDIKKLKDYDEILHEKFDLVVAKVYKPEYTDYLKWYGVFVGMSKGRSDEGLLKDPSSPCVAVTETNSLVNSRDDFIESVSTALKECLEYVLKSNDLPLYIPRIDTISNLKVDDSVVVTHSGVQSGPCASGLLELYNRTLTVYNPLYSTYTGVTDALHKSPATCLVDFNVRMDNLKDFGFKVTEAPAARDKAKRMMKKFDFLTTPLMPPLPQQAFAYIKEGDIKAVGKSKLLGVKKGEICSLKVGWSKRRDVNLERGFMTASVNDYTVFEDSEEDVKAFIDAFGLPKISHMESSYPEIVDGWRKKAKKMFPQLLDFQADDIALAATKPCVYLAHDRGLGKTFMSAAWAKLRGYKRVLVIAQSQYLDKWKSELDQFGFKSQHLTDWKAVRELKDQIKAGIKNTDTVFYLCSYEFLSLESNIKFDPWTCTELDKRGYITAIVDNIKAPKCPSCGKTSGQAREVCPNCNSKNYNGRYCNDCKQASYSYKREKPLTPEKCAEIEKQAQMGIRDFHSGTYPAYKKLKKLFSCVIPDESQAIKNKNTLRSTAVRSLHSKGKLLVTANLMRNYPYELFWPVSWLLGFNNPMFPYKYKGGYPVFENQFGTRIFKGITRTLSGAEKEMWDRIPEVSNLTILWKLMAPFMVRRLAEDVEGMQPKTIERVNLSMDEDHAALYHAVRKSNLNALSEELRKANPDAKVVGANLWSLRAASTIPTANRYFQNVDASYTGTWSKMNWIIEKARDMRDKKKKMIVFSFLVDMGIAVKAALDRNGIKAVHIKQSSKGRFETIKAFNSGAATVLVSSPELIGRCYDIEAASNVVIADVGWTPEEVEQAMDRARRLTSEKPVSVFFLLNEGTIDEHMYDIVMQKGEAIKNVLDRRAVYQPADILREAVQIQVAKRIISEKVKFKKPAAAVQPQVIVVDLPIPSTVNFEQMGLFDMAA